MGSCPQGEICPTQRGAKHLTAIGYVPSWLDRPPPAKAPAPKKRPRAVAMRSRYDAADTGPENRNHWSLADDLSANAAASPDVRQTLRRRARYERDNDPHLNGLTLQLGNDLVGTGPRWTPQLPPEHNDAIALVVASWKAWARATDLAEKLRLLHEPRAPDGETFALLTTNPMVPHPVKLDLRVLEAEQVATPTLSYEPGAVDGIEFDQYGNPSFYHVLRRHPGDSWGWLPGEEYDRVPARLVLHWFRPRRPSQARGVSEFASVLPIGSQTRRYAAAVLMKAEYAAGISGVMTTDLPTPDDADEEDPVSMDEVTMPRGSLITLPYGWEASFAETEPPSDSYVSFVDSKRGEMGRPVLAPRNRVTGDSSQFNFASGRIDGLPYQDGAWIERDRFRNRVLDRIFLAFYAELFLVGLVPDTLPPVNEWEWDWHWDAFGSLNPIDDANTSEKRLTLGLTTLAEECAADGKDWREVLRQRAAEQEFAESLGLTLPWLAPPAPAPMPADLEAPDEA